MIACVLLVLWLTALAVPALAEGSAPPTSAVEAPPAKTQTAPERPPKPPSAAPAAAVQQVAPLSTPASKPARGKKPTPVVRPSPNWHAQNAATGQVGPAPVAAPPAKPAPAKPNEPGKGSVSGLPLPRWASLRSDEVNLRAGPGTRYPVDWVYHRRGLPVQIEREFEVWRLIDDQDGVQAAGCTRPRSSGAAASLREAEALLRQCADDAAPAVALLKQGVIGRIRACAAKADWCEMQVSSYRGFLRRTQFWGTFPGEAVHD